MCIVSKPHVESRRWGHFARELAEPWGACKHIHMFDPRIPVTEWDDADSEVERLKEMNIYKCAQPGYKTAIRDNGGRRGECCDTTPPLRRETKLEGSLAILARPGSD